MSTIIFATAPAMGHLNAPLTLAKSLSARGHEIYYLQGLRYKTYIEEQGVHFIPPGESSASILSSTLCDTIHLDNPKMDARAVSQLAISAEVN